MLIEEDYLSVLNLIKPPKCDLQTEGRIGEFYKWKIKVIRVVSILGIEEETNFNDPTLTFESSINHYITKMVKLERSKDSILTLIHKTKWLKACKYLNEQNGKK